MHAGGWLAARREYQQVAAASLWNLKGIVAAPWQLVATNDEKATAFSVTRIPAKYEWTVIGTDIRHTERRR